VRRAILLLIVAFCVAAPPAVASDRSVRAAVCTAESKHFGPAADAFARASRRFSRTAQAGPFRTSVRRLVAAVGTSQRIVARERATGAKARRGRSTFLAMLAHARGALALYDAGLRQWQAKERVAAANTLARAAARFSLAGREERRALALLGLKRG
jgi:hypothetical protein